MRIDPFTDTERVGQARHREHATELSRVRESGP